MHGIVLPMPDSAQETPNSRPQAVIFDFDGTIADSFDYVFKFLKKEAGNETNFDEKDLSSLRRMSMRKLAVYLGVPLWRLPWTFFRGRRAMREHMEQVQPFEGMIEVIRQLNQEGAILFIASSNSAKNIRHLLRRQGILDCFRAVQSSAGITGKSAMIRQIILRYRLRRDETWYIGDEVGDIISADRAGVKALPVAWGFADPERLKTMRPNGIAQKPSDILRIVDTWKK